ncbi:MAG TPA: hypothetical protein VFS92_10830 [Planctomycetota bacterium]|nr:hypothetical protein [Planctomycetota bacterium]
MKTPCALLALALAAGPLSGCYAARRMFVLEASGSDLAADWASDVFRDQCERTADGITGLPGKLGDHFRYCWRSATSRDPVGR